MTHVTCRLTAKNRDQLRNPTLGSQVWATFTFTLNIAVDERLQTSEIRLQDLIRDMLLGFIQLKRWPFVALKIGGTTVNYPTLESGGYAYPPKITLMLPVSTPCSASAIVSCRSVEGADDEWRSLHARELGDIALLHGTSDDAIYDYWSPSPDHYTTVPRADLGHFSPPN